MKRHKSIGPMLWNGELKFWTPVNFEVEYFLEETEGVLTDTVIYFSDQHLTWLSQLKPNDGWVSPNPTHLGKSCQTYLNYMPKCRGRSTEQ